MFFNRKLIADPEEGTKFPESSVLKKSTRLFDLWLLFPLRNSQGIFTLIKRFSVIYETANVDWLYD